MAVGAAVATALAFLAIGAIPKSEPALVVAMWFHGSSLLTAAVALTVGPRAVLGSPGLSNGIHLPCSRLDNALLVQQYLGTSCLRYTAAVRVARLCVRCSGYATLHQAPASFRDA